MKLPVELIARAEAQFKREPEEIAAIRERIKKADARTLDGNKQYEARKEMIANVAREDVLDAQERYLGDNDLLPINYLLLGYLQSRSVGRLRYFDKAEGKVATATGFLISESLMMTNHHVFPVDRPGRVPQFCRRRDDRVQLRVLARWREDRSGHL